MNRLRHFGLRGQTAGPPGARAALRSVASTAAAAALSSVVAVVSWVVVADDWASDERAIAAAASGTACSCEASIPKFDDRPTDPPLPTAASGEVRRFKARTFQHHQSMPVGAMADMSSVQGFRIADSAAKSSAKSRIAFMEVGICVAQNSRGYQEDSWAVLARDIAAEECEPLTPPPRRSRWASWWPWVSSTVDSGSSVPSEGEDDARPTSVPGTDAAAVLAVFDGHGGDECSKHATMNFHCTFENEMRKEIETQSERTGRSSRDALIAALERTLLELDRTFVAGKRDPGAIGPEPVNDPTSMRFGGSTAVAVAVDLVRGLLICSNVGDSRVVLVRWHRTAEGAEKGPKDDSAPSSPEGEMVAIPLSNDHSPASRPDEVERILRLGGEVRTNPWERAMVIAAGGKASSCQRVYHANGVGGLNMTRALGDVYLKPLVIPTPETTTTPICAVRNAGSSEFPSFLVLASDGVWDVLSNEEVASSVWNIFRVHAANQNNVPVDYSRVVRGVALALVQTAQKAGSKDNITCMVLKLPRQFR